MDQEKQRIRRQKSKNLVGFFLRIPADLKARLDQASKEKRISQAQLANQLIEEGLERAIVDIPEQMKEWLERNKKNG